MRNENCYGAPYKQKPVRSSCRPRLDPDGLRRPNASSSRSSPTSQGTLVRMVQTGFRGVKGWFVPKGAQMGWKKLLNSGLPVVFDGTAPKVVR